jgi:hypothetical protein
VSCGFSLATIGADPAGSCNAACKLFMDAKNFHISTGNAMLHDEITPK